MGGFSALVDDGTARNNMISLEATGLWEYYKLTSDQFVTTEVEYP